MSYKALQRLAKSGPAVKRGEVLPGDIVQAAAIKVVRMSSLPKREALPGLGLGAVAKRPGDPGIGPEPESEAESSDEDSRRDVCNFLPFRPSSPRMLICQLVAM